MIMKIVAVTVLLIASLSIASCTSSTSPCPTATPSAASPPALTQDQLNTAENTMTSNGYTVTEHLVANGTGTDGSLYYTGQLAKNGSTYDYTIIVCNDPVTADSHFSSSVSFVQQLGFSSSYSNDGSSWTGTMLYNGVPIGAGVTELTNSAPYTVVEFFGGSATPTVQPTVTPSVQPTPTPEATAIQSGHNAVLEQTVSTRQQEEYSLIGYTTGAWNVIWNNDNSVTILSTQIANGTNTQTQGNETLIAFPTTQDATNYLNALDLSKYSLVSGPLDLYPVADHVPQNQHWDYSDNISTPNMLYEIHQYDNILQFITIQGPY